MAKRIVIIGGGVMGASTAYFLCADPGFAGEVLVLERDPTYTRASSALSASSIRTQFSSEINIRIGMHAIEFLREVPQRLAIDGDAPSIGLVEPGYLFLASAQGAPILEENHRAQRRCGARVALLDPSALASRFPWLAVEGLAAGAHGESGEGWFDGPALHQAFRRKARSLGARFVAVEAVGVATEGRRVSKVRLGDGSHVACDVAVNAAGPWAAPIGDWLGFDLPVRPRARSVFVVSCPSVLAPPAGGRPNASVPLVIDPGGVWFRPEGSRFLCGVSPPAERDPDGAPLEVDHTQFDEIVWPALAARVPAFEALRVESAWAGYYDYNTFDQNGIVGPHPHWENLLLANGFSGHGMQQSPVVGRGLAEWIVHGAYRTLDLAPLGVERIARGTPLIEKNVV